MRNGPVTVKDLYHAIRESELANAKIAAAMKALTAEEEVNEDILTALQNASEIITHLESIIGNLEL